jgi:predicted MFS family arabinose efflux permease
LTIYAHAKLTARDWISDSRSLLSLDALEVNVVSRAAGITLSIAIRVVAVLVAPPRAVIPLIVGRGPDLGSANAWSTAARGMTRLAGAPLGGALYTALGFHWVVSLDTISYLISAGCIAALPALRSQRHEPTVPADSRGQRNRALRALAHDFATGIVCLLRARILAAMAGISALFLLGNGALTALLVPYVSARLHGTATTLGILYSALGVGHLLSAYPGRKLCASSRLRATLLGLLVSIVTPFAVFFNTSSPAAAAIALRLAGLPGGAILMLEQVLMSKRR